MSEPDNIAEKKMQGNALGDELESLKQLQPLNTLSDSHIREVLKSTELVVVEEGKMLFKRGQECEYYYYIIDGSVDLLDDQYKVKSISSTEDRANKPLDNHDPYIVSAVMTAKSTVLQVSKDRLDLVLTWNQAGNYLVEEFDDEASSMLENDWITCLLASPIFLQVPPTNLQELFVKFDEVNYALGQTVITEGEPGEDFFVIKSGRADVIKSQDGQDVKVAELMVGDYFGEEALLGDTVRNASVVMSAPGDLMKLGKGDFKQLLEKPVVNYVNSDTLEEWKASEQSVSFLDVRLPVEIPEDERDDRLILPLPNLRSRLNILDKETVYVIDPAAGERRATLGAYLLNQAGYTAVILKQE